MTGFGRGQAREGAVEATVEVRAVNGRYAEATVRGLGDLAEHETAVQNAVKASVDRGNATVHVSLTRDGGSAAAPHVVDAGPYAARGRGLAMVQALCADWGVERSDGTLVRATLVC